MPKILCIGRNYVEHIKELGNEIPKEPFFFLKPFSSIVEEPGKIRLKEGIGRVDHEVELGLVIGKRGNNFSEDEAMGMVREYMVALDLTARDLQNKAKAKGLPWSFAKGMDTFCPLGSRFAGTPDLSDLKLVLEVNGQLRQSGNTSQMILNVPQIISYCSQFMTLEPDDIILTGTPSGVGPIQSSDHLSASLLDNKTNSLLSHLSISVE